MAERKIAWERITLVFAVLGVAVCLVIYKSSTKGDPVCRGIDITVTNAEVAGTVTVKEIEKMLEQNNIAGKGRLLTSDVTKKTLKLLKSKAYIKNAHVYCTGDSILHVELEQRVPALRILTGEGSCYIDSDGIAFPVSERRAYRVPLITGAVRLPAEGKMMRDTLFARNLLAFADYISGNPFWNAQIQQISVAGNGNIEFTVCSDSHLVRFGQLHGYESKLDNLLTFYMKVNPYYMAENDMPYTTLDMRFKGQMVAVKGN
jgi:cell division protein FtsQ